MENTSQEIWRSMYQLHYRRIYAVAFSLTRDTTMAEDVCHDAFLEAFRNLRQLRDLNKMGAWIAGIAINIAKSMLKRSGKIVPSETVEIQASLCASEDESPEDDVINKELKESILAVIRCLPVEFQQVVVLRYYYDLEYKDIAQILNISNGTVKSRLHRAHGRLKNLLEGTNLIDGKGLSECEAL